MNLDHWDWNPIELGKPSREMAPTHPDAEAVHWPKPADACERCGVHGHTETSCVYEEGEL